MIMNTVAAIVVAGMTLAMLTTITTVSYTAMFAGV